MSALGRCAQRATSRPAMQAQKRCPIRTVRAAATEQMTSNSNGIKPSSSETFTYEEITDIIRQVDSTDIVELALKGKNFSLVARKREALVQEQPIVQQVVASAPVGVAPAVAAPAPVAPMPAPPSAPAPAPAAPAPEPEASPADGVEIASPMSGTFYRSPAPGEPPFCKDTDRVTKGQTVCIIEAMKLMNEIESEVNGDIVKYLVQNGDPVQPGQPLLLIKPC